MSSFTGLETIGWILAFYATAAIIVAFIERDWK